MKNLVILMVALFSSSLAVAHNFKLCKVVEVISQGETNAHVQLNCTVNNAPACAQASNYVAFDKSNQEGRSFLTMFLTAFSMNAYVTGDVDTAACPEFQPNVSRLTHLRMSK